MGFLRKLKHRMLLKKLHKLSSEAFELNKKIKKSDLPDEIKENSAQIIDYYTKMLLNFNSIGDK